MSDIADVANKVVDEELKRALLKAKQDAAQFDPGRAGECDNCGIYFERVVNGYCGRCRDKLGIG